MFDDIAIIQGNKRDLHFISIADYSEALITEITSEIGKIWNGDLDGKDEIELIKLEISSLLSSKSIRQQHGLVSEFICHIYLRSKAFEQYFLFRNLEEKGMKKGFDGIYLSNDSFWIYESKSSLSDTKDASHNSNISEAYNDLKKKIEGTNRTNNPWKNAYTHLSNRAIKENTTLAQTIKSFSSDYTKGKYYDISKFNVIPSSTLYLDNKWNTINSEELNSKLSKLIKKYQCKNILVICINKKSINDFLNFLK